jgi:hypothetical protein
VKYYKPFPLFCSKKQTLGISLRYPTRFAKIMQAFLINIYPLIPIAWFMCPKAGACDAEGKDHCLRKKMPKYGRKSPKKGVPDQRTGS